MKLLKKYIRAADVMIYYSPALFICKKYLTDKRYSLISYEQYEGYLISAWCSEPCKDK